MSSRTAAVVTLGCKTNQFESAAMEERLRTAGLRIVPFEAGAELVVVNTCSVTAATDAQSRNLIRRARRLHPPCRIIVTGCYAQIDPEALRALPGVAVVLGNDEKTALLDFLQIEGREPVVAVADIRAAAASVALPLAPFAERSRAFVQIQNGCDAFCAYCIIPYARGRSRSLAPEEVLQQVRQLTASGSPEVVLTGIHIGGYGADLTPPTSLLHLLRRIEDQTDLPRLRLGSLEPTDISAAFIEQIASSAILCPHLHIPLQAGDDAVLARMNRHYDTAFFRALVEKVRARLPEAAIGLDVITGFPGETDEEFANTCRFIDSLPVTHLHVFPFSKRPGTPAATMADQVPGDVAKERAAQLRALGEAKLRDFSQTFVGETLEVVVEGGMRGEEQKGLARNYLNVTFPAADVPAGQTALVYVETLGARGLRGRVV